MTLDAESLGEAVLGVLRDSGEALLKSEILDRLATAGVPRSGVEDAWGPLQRRLRLDNRVIAEKDRHHLRYRWNPDAPPAPTAADALALLVEGRLTRGEREALAQTVRSALAAVAPEPAVSPDRPHQVEVDAATELAGLAIEVEEQVTKGASAKAVIHRVRSRMKRLRLQPVEKAGETVAFDRGRHQPMRPGIPDGASVVVVRPGYVWLRPGGDLVIERPVVQD